MQWGKRMSLAGLAVLVLASQSRADSSDTRGHSGGACRPVRAESAALFSTVGRIQHRGSAPEDVVCPVVRERLHAPQAPLDVSITVQSTGASRLTCTFYSLSSTGNLLGAFSKATYSASPTALFVNVPPGYVGFAGSQYIRCTLPPGGSVVNYYAGETADREDGR
jgi:hypothetical protein